MDTNQRPRGWKRTATEIITPGVIGGLIAGLVMLVLALIHSAAVGLGFTWPLHRVGSAVLEMEAHGAGSAILGLVLHLAIAAVWGVLFVALVPRGAPNHLALGMGLAFGLMVFVVMTWLVVPWADDAMWQTLPKTVLFLYHLAFGALLALAVPIRRQVTQAEVPASARRITV